MTKAETGVLAVAKVGQLRNGSAQSMDRHVNTTTLNL